MASYLSGHNEFKSHFFPAIAQKEWVSHALVEGMNKIITASEAKRYPCLNVQF